MLYEEVIERVVAHESRQEAARNGLVNAARESVLYAADQGSRKSTLDLSEFPQWAAQVSWLRKEWRGQGISISVDGSFLHFNATGPRGSRRRSVHDYDNTPESKAW